MLCLHAAAALLAFAPTATHLAPANTRIASAARSRDMVAPMDFVSDLPCLEVMLPHHLVADQSLRQLVYAARLFAGATGFEGALAGADLIADIRMFATASTVGTVRSARGLASAFNTGSGLLGIQHASMLLHHPVMLGKWASQFVMPVAIAPTISASGRSVCAVLWLAFIAAYAVRNLKACGSATGAERRTIHLTLRKLALDVPLATHFMMGASLLPLAVVGLLGTVSSILGVRAARADPHKAESPRLSLPLPRWSMRRVAVAIPNRPHPTLVHCVASAAPRCAQQRRRIGGGPLSSSCEW